MDFGQISKIESGFRFEFRSKFEVIEFRSRWKTSKFDNVEFRSRISVSECISTALTSRTPAPSPGIRQLQVTDQSWASETSAVELLLSRAVGYVNQWPGLLVYKGAMVYVIRYTSFSWSMFDATAFHRDRKKSRPREEKYE